MVHLNGYIANDPTETECSHRSQETLRWRFVFYGFKAKELTSTVRKPASGFAGAADGFVRRNLAPQDPARRYPMRDFNGNDPIILPYSDAQISKALLADCVCTACASSHVLG